MRPELEIVAAELEERAARAGVTLVVEGDAEIELAIRPRMLRVIAQNLAENAIRYAGPGATFTLAVEREGRRDRAPRHATTASASTRTELSRLFERFYRADRARASRGTGLGLAIVKHIVTQAGGTVEARGGGGGARGPLRVPGAAPASAPFTGFSPLFTSRRPTPGAGGRQTLRRRVDERDGSCTIDNTQARGARGRSRVLRDGRARAPSSTSSDLTVTYSGQPGAQGRRRSRSRRTS